VPAASSVTGYGLHSTVLAASLVYLLPGTAGAILTAPLGGRLVGRFGPKNTLVTAALLALAGFVLLALLHGATWEIIVGASAVNTAVMLGYAALPALLIEHVTPAETGIANSVNSISRSVGMSLGTAFVVTMVTRNPISAAVPLPHESQFVATFLVGAALAAAAAAVVGWALPRRPRPGLSVREVEEEEVFGAAGLAVPEELAGRSRA
jgi:MFS family permease